MNFAFIIGRLLNNLKWLQRASDPRAILGKRGEKEAAKFLARRGYGVLVRNYHRPLGEVDLIARDRDTLVFVEVKSRIERIGDTTDPVRRGQWRRIERAARCFIQEKSLHHRSCRFDLVQVTFHEKSPAKIEHFIDVYHPSRP